MTYQIAKSDKTGNLYVVQVAEGRIVHICRKCDDRADAEQLLRDLAAWRL